MPSRIYSQMSIERPLQDKGMAELAQQLSRNSQAGRNFGASGMDYFYERDRAPNILYKPASEQDIEGLQQRARQSGFPNGLPEDYVEFLRLSNGIGNRYPRDYDEIFAPVSLVAFERSSGRAMKHTLFPLKGELKDLGIKVDWPDEIWALNIGIGGEGHQHIFPETVAKPVGEGLRKALEKTKDPAKKAEIEHIAKLMAGSLDDLPNMRCFVTRFVYPLGWTELFCSFKRLLESLVEDTTEKPRKGKGAQKGV